MRVWLHGRTDRRCVARRTHARTCCVCVRARACAIGRPRIRADTCERFPSASTAGGLGAQAFYYADKFNANIGAWNTASVTTLDQVCAAFSALRRPCARARVRVCDWAAAYPRRHMRALSVGVNRWWPRRAGVPPNGGVQREHRRVEHRRGHHVVQCMRRLFGPGGAPPQAGCAQRVVDAAQAVVRGGAGALLCAGRRVGPRMRGRPRV
jgi:surface protein